jgi:predicted HTH transcriptional regulator
MGAIPKSDLPGHKRLHEKAVLALDTCQEDDDVDFKESAPWEALKWRITHSSLGMGNLRDGGMLLIGVAERSGRWELTGITPDHLSTYDPDDIAAHINAYASPHVDLDVVLVRHHEGRDYLAIYVREFRDTPFVCKKNGPDKSRIIAGRVYVRLPSPARTTAITGAQQMHDLLELAAEKRARTLLEKARRVGLTEPSFGDNRFDAELAGL